MKIYMITKQSRKCSDVIQDANLIDDLVLDRSVSIAYALLLHQSFEILTLRRQSGHFMSFIYQFILLVFLIPFVNHHYCSFLPVLTCLVITYYDSIFYMLC